MFKPETAAKSTYMYDLIKGAKDMLAGTATELEGLTVEDDTHFTFVLESPMVTFINNLGISYAQIYPQKACEEAGDQWGWGTNCVGTGKYKIVENDDTTCLLYTSKAERQEILSKLKVGMRLKGTVSSIVDFGAFVDLGGIDGLVHISELSWNHVNHPSEVVKVGQEVEVQVLDVDLNRERISLGLKQTTEDPWRTLVKKYPVDAIVEGKVTKLVTFGAFVDLGDGVEGLVHLSLIHI